MKELKYNLKLVISDINFYRAVLFCFIVNTVQFMFVIKDCIGKFPYFEQLSSAEGHMILSNYELTFGIILIFFPIVFSMNLAVKRSEEFQSNTLNLLKSRLNIKKLIVTGAILVFFLTFIVCFVSFLWNYLLCKIVFTSSRYYDAMQYFPFYSKVSVKYFLSSLKQQSPILYTVLIMAAISLVFAIISLFSYGVSLYIKNKTVVSLSGTILILSSVVLTTSRYVSYSLVILLQPTSLFTGKEYIVTNVCILFISIILILNKIIQEEIL